MTRWYLALLAAYALILAQAYRDCKKIWRQARLLRAVMGK
jgi:hypothetical protein